MDAERWYAKPEPRPMEPSAVVSGVSEAIDKDKSAYTADDHGLGPVGEMMVRRGMEADEKLHGPRDIALFSHPWLRLIHLGNMNEKFVAGLQRAGNREMRRTARRDAIKASWLQATALGGLAFGFINYSSTAVHWIVEHVPLIRSILRLLLENGL